MEDYTLLVWNCIPLESIPLERFLMHAYNKYTYVSCACKEKKKLLVWGHEEDREDMCVFFNAEYNKKRDLSMQLHKLHFPERMNLLFWSASSSINMQVGEYNKWLCKIKYIQDSAYCKKIKLLYPHIVN